MEDAGVMRVAVVVLGLSVVAWLYLYAFGAPVKPWVRRAAGVASVTTAGLSGSRAYSAYAAEKAVLKMRELMYAGKDDLAFQILETMATEAQARQLNRQSEEAELAREAPPAARSAGRLH